MVLIKWCKSVKCSGYCVAAKLPVFQSGGSGSNSFGASQISWLCTKCFCKKRSLSIYTCHGAAKLWMCVANAARMMLEM